MSWNGLLKRRSGVAEILGAFALYGVYEVVRGFGGHDIGAAMLNTELAKANEVGERMSIPMSLLGVIFLAILVAPSLLRVIGGDGP